MSFKEKVSNFLFGPRERRASQCYEMGMRRLSKGDIFGAEFHFRTATKLQPDSSTYLVGYGNALFAKQDFVGAVEQYSKVTESSSNAILLSNWGVALRILGRINEAVEKHEAAVALAPDDPKTLVNAGITFVDSGKIENAISMFKRALEINPKNEDARRNLKALGKAAE